MPPIFYKKHKQQPLRVYAHRGSNRIFPENTLPAFAHALKEQATHLELDLQSTQDGYIVVAHDPDGRRIAGVNKNIKECSLSDVQSWDLTEPFLASRAKNKISTTKKYRIQRGTEKLPYPAL